MEGKALSQPGHRGRVRRHQVEPVGRGAAGQYLFYWRLLREDTVAPVLAAEQ